MTDVGRTYKDVVKLEFELLIFFMFQEIKAPKLEKSQGRSQAFRNIAGKNPSAPLNPQTLSQHRYLNRHWKQFCYLLNS